MGDNFMLIVLWVFVTAVCIAMECDYSFTFPTVNNSVFNVEENANISLPFAFSSKCGLPDEFRITVAKARSLPPMVCQIIHENGTCTVHANYGASCKCLLEEGEGEYLLTKEAEQDDSDTWIWWKDSKQDQGTRLAVHIIAKNNGNVTDSSIRTVAQSTTAEETNNQSEFFYTQNLVIPFAIAGFVLLAIVAFIFVYAKAGRGTANFIARMRQEVLAEALPRRPSVDLGVAPSIELIWDSRDPRYQPARRAAKRSRAAIPFVQENADTRPKSILSENIYHEIGEHADDGELPQNDSQSNPQPSMDEDGYLAPRDLIRQGAAKQM